MKPILYLIIFTCSMTASALSGFKAEDPQKNAKTVRIYALVDKSKSMDRYKDKMHEAALVMLEELNTTKCDVNWQVAVAGVDKAKAKRYHSDSFLEKKYDEAIRVASAISFHNRGSSFEAPLLNLKRLVQGDESTFDSVDFTGVLFFTDSFTLNSSVQASNLKNEISQIIGNDKFKSWSFHLPVQNSYKNCAPDIIGLPMEALEAKTQDLYRSCETNVLEVMKSNKQKPKISFTADAEQYCHPMVVNKMIPELIPAINTDSRVQLISAMDEFVESTGGHSYNLCEADFNSKLRRVAQSLLAGMGCYPDQLSLLQDHSIKL